MSNEAMSNETSATGNRTSTTSLGTGFQRFVVPISQLVDALLRSEAATGSPPTVDISGSEIPDIGPLIRTWNDEDHLDPDKSIFETIRARKRSQGWMHSIDGDNYDNDWDMQRGIREEIYDKGLRLDYREDSWLAENASRNERANCLNEPPDDIGIKQDNRELRYPWTHPNLKTRYYQTFNNNGYHQRISYNEESILNLSLLTDIQDLHNGCVNRLCWSSDGTHLASVSDDCNLCLSSLKSLYTGNTKTPLKIDSGHSRNIFGVCFVGDSNTKVATGAMDDEVRLHEINPIGTSHTRLYKCHKERVKEVISLRGSSLWWSCSEDGTIRQFDCRIAHKCRNNGRTTCPNVLIGAETEFRVNHHLMSKTSPRRGVIPISSYWKRRKHSSRLDAYDSLRQPPKFVSNSDARPFGNIAWKSIALNPIRTDYLLAASDDPLIRVYDRRMLSQSASIALTPPSSLPCETYLPLQLSLSPRKLSTEFLMIDRLHPTHIAWRRDGREFLATYSIGDVFVFPFNSCRTDDSSELHLSIKRNQNKTSTLNNESNSINQNNHRSKDENSIKSPVVIDSQECNPVNPVNSSDCIITANIDEQHESSIKKNDIDNHIAVDNFDILPDSISDALHTVTHDFRDYSPLFVQLVRDEERRHPLYNEIKQLQLKGNSYIKLRQYSDAIVAYTAALRLCGPPWPIHILPELQQSSPSSQPCSQITSTVTDEHSEPSTDLISSGHQILKSHHRRSHPTFYVTLDQQISNLRSPILCNRSLALTKRGSENDTYQAEADALESLSYDATNMKAAYRLLQAYKARRPVMVQSRNHNELKREVFVLQRIGLMFEDKPSFLSKTGATLDRMKDEYFQSIKLKEDPLGDKRASLLSVGMTIFNNFRESIPWWIGYRKSMPGYFGSRDENDGSSEEDESDTNLTVEGDIVERTNKGCDEVVMNIKSDAGSLTPQSLSSSQEDQETNENLDYGSIDGGRIDQPLAKKSCPSNTIDTFKEVHVIEDLNDIDCYSLMDYYDYYDLIDDPYWQPRLIADRFHGRKNQLTDIQEASFYGNRFIVSGSDSPHIIIWRRNDGAIVKTLDTKHREGVNCVQPHPQLSLLASSGLGNNIQIWSPIDNTS